MGNWLRGVVFQVVIYAIMGLMGLLGAPVVLWSRDWTRRWCRLYVRIVLRAAKTICGLRSEIRGEVPGDDVLVAAKHQSMLDVFMIYDALPFARFVMKRELVWVPVFGAYALRVGTVTVDRNARGAGERMVERFERNRSSGQIVIYPQGTRVSPGSEARYRRGAIRLYHRFGLPMVLAATNTGIFWPRRGWAIRPGTAVVDFGERLPPGLDTEEVSRRMEAAIERASAALEDEAVQALGLSPIERRKVWEEQGEA